MNEQILKRERRRELLITLAYTFFSVLMIIMTAVEGWPLVYIPIIAIELAFIWWSYTTGFKTYMFRAVVVTSAICLNIFLYGIQGENFTVLIPTLCTQFVLLSLYEIARIMDIVVLETIALVLYHAFVNPNPMIPADHLGRSRMMLQVFSLIALVLLCVYRIRHHVQEEEDTVMLEEQLRREQKIKDDFVANTSHELRTPVNTISGMCEILLQKMLPDDVHSNVADIQMTGVELQNIISDIMDYAALESGTLRLTPREYNITSTLNDVMNIMVFENSDKNLEIIFDCDPNIPSILEGDEQQLRRIMNSLIGNAIKFTKEGGVVVRVSYREEKYGINLIVSVKDTGVGLSLEEQERILQGFYQEDSDRNRKNSGMGLGLTISSSLIKLMGGFMTIKSVQGRGSEFTFAIPQKVVKSDPCISLEHPGAVKLVWYYDTHSNNPYMRDARADYVRNFADYFGITVQRASTLAEVKRIASKEWGVQFVLGQNEYMQDKEYFDALSGMVNIIMIADYNAHIDAAPRIHVLHKPYNTIMLAEILNGREQGSSRTRRKQQKRFIAPQAKILVVDDNLMNLRVVEGLLRKYRIRIVTATSGEEALSLIESRDFDFVFMDHMMPGMDGVECFHHIRAKQGTYFSRVPVIALTANAIAGSREMFLNEGFDEFVAKPIDTAQLNEVLERFIPEEKQIEDFEEEPEVQEAPEEKDEKPEIVNEEDAVSDGGLEGIDMESAMLYCGSMEDFRELAAVYCKSGDKYIRQLRSNYEDKDWDNYQILAHTIKSTSKTLGALKFSDLAFGQELAGKEGNEDLIRKHHDEFITEYARILRMLSAYINAGGESGEADAGGDAGASEIEDWPALRSRLLECLESLEAVSFEECLGDAKGGTLGGRPIEEVLSGVCRKVENFDFEGAAAELGRIGGEA